MQTAIPRRTTMGDKRDFIGSLQQHIFTSKTTFARASKPGNQSSDPQDFFWIEHA
jgi:hypothetical protein